MNVAVVNPDPSLPPRRAFNVEDIRRMVEAGVLAENEKIELVEGEIIVKTAKDYAHERIKNALVEALIKVEPVDIEIGVQEYWVVDTNERLTWIYSGASDTGWASIMERDFADMLTTAALPAFQIRLDHIEMN